MTKPTPDDYRLFESWKINNTDTKSMNTNSYEGEYAKLFEGVNIQHEIEKAEEFDRFFLDHSIDLELENTIAEETSQIFATRNELLIVLNFFDWSIKSEAISSNTTLISLFKYFTIEAQKLFANKKDISSLTDKTIVFVLKTLVKLIEEGVAKDSTLEDIIVILSDKYNELKGIK